MTSAKGNVLFLILIAIGLFAALSYAMTQQGRGGASIDQERASLLAGEIFRQLATFDQAIGRLRLIKKCDDTEISFAHDSDDDGDIDSNDDYYNPNAPTDFKCHVFHQSGGGLDWVKIPPLALDDAHSAEATYGEYFFPNLVRVKGIGTDCDTADCSELLVVLPYLKEAVAKEVNNRTGIIRNGLGSDNVCNLDFDDGDKFIGTFSAGCGASSTYSDNIPDMERRRTGCTNRLGQNECYHVLVPR